MLQKFVKYQKEQKKESYFISWIFISRKITRDIISSQFHWWSCTIERQKLSLFRKTNKMFSRSEHYSFSIPRFYNTCRIFREKSSFLERRKTSLVVHIKHPRFLPHPPRGAIVLANSWKVVGRFWHYPLTIPALPLFFSLNAFSTLTPPLLLSSGFPIFFALSISLDNTECLSRPWHGKRRSSRTIVAFVYLVRIINLHICIGQIISSSVSLLWLI